MDGGCDAHQFATAPALCSECLCLQCAGCLVYADLDALAPVCLPCALRIRAVRRTKRPRRRERVVDLRH